MLNLKHKSDFHIQQIPQIIPSPLQKMFIIFTICPKNVNHFPIIKNFLKYFILLSFLSFLLTPSHFLISILWSCKQLSGNNFSCNSNMFKTLNGSNCNSCCQQLQAAQHTVISAHLSAGPTMTTRTMTTTSVRVMVSVGVCVCFGMSVCLFQPLTVTFLTRVLWYVVAVVWLHTAATTITQPHYQHHFQPSSGHFLSHTASKRTSTHTRTSYISLVFVKYEDVLSLNVCVG